MPSGKFTDPEYLRTRQYADDRNLQARIALHRRFSTNAYGWFQWYLDQVSLPPAARILEVGCGPAALWQDVLPRLPGDWRITLSDLSLGMVRAARGNLSAHSSQFTFTVNNAQTLPFPSGHFDAVFANHMLYHVPDLAAALREIRRVLKAGGTLYAATNGERHMEAINIFGRAFAEAVGVRLDDGFSNRNLRFSLENGAKHLRPYFTRVERRDYPDALEVTEAEPLAAYLLSTTSAVARLDSRRRPRVEAALLAFAREYIAARGGSLHVAKSTGLFIAR